MSSSVLMQSSGDHNLNINDSNFFGFSPLLQPPRSTADSAVPSNTATSGPTISSPNFSVPSRGSRGEGQQQQQGQNLSELGSTGPASASATKHLYSRSCGTCRRRKVRCNKESPCSNCVKSGAECVFPSPGRAPRRSKGSSNTQLHSRLKRLENVIESIRADNDTNSNTANNAYMRVSTNGETTTSPVISPLSTAPRDDAAKNNQGLHGREKGCSRNIMALDSKDFARESQTGGGRMVVNQGRSRYVGNRLWASLGDEIEELHGVLELSSSDEDDSSSPISSLTPSTNHGGFFFGYNSLAHSLSKYHPLPSQILILWDAFIENVDPVVTILHKPTAKGIIVDASINSDNLDKNAEALVFTIYFAAVVSMSAEQCSSLLEEDREVVIERYRFAVEQALARANFLNTQSLMLLQAMVLFLFCVRPVDDSKFVWSMTGVVFRLAQGLGLHRDGAKFGLKPLETELRRRLWWYLYLLDLRSAEEHGTDAMINDKMHDVRLPMNINDEDISWEMQEMPQERVGCTEMTFTLVRCEMASYLRRASYLCPGGWCLFGRGEVSVEESERWIKGIKDHLEERYIQYCDPNVPIYLVTVSVVRVIIAKLWLTIHHPMIRRDRENSLSRVPRHSLLLTAVELIELSIFLVSHEAFAKWRWLYHIYIQWPAIVFILSEICVRPICPLTERAWIAVTTLYEEWERGDKKGAMWRPIRQLLRRAADFRTKQQEEHQPRANDESTTLYQQHHNCIPPLQLGSDRLFTPTQSLPRTFASGQWSGPGTNPYTDQATPGLLNDQDFQNGNPGLSTLLAQQQSPTGMDSSYGVYENATTNAYAPQDWTADLDLDWTEWDKVFREFQMDLEKEEATFSLGNVSDWLV